MQDVLGVSNRNYVISPDANVRPTPDAYRRYCETFRIPSLMSIRTIRIPDEGRLRRRRDLRLRRSDRVAVEQKFSTY